MPEQTPDPEGVEDGVFGLVVETGMVIGPDDDPDLKEEESDATD